jgi:hypothetical protein
VLQTSPFVPDWYPNDANHVIFQGSPRSVVIYNSPGSPIHVNWQCPQFIGEPTVYFRPSDGMCVQCSGQVILDANNLFYQSCSNGNENVLGNPVIACQ